MSNHIDCPCWATGVFVQVPCPQHDGKDAYPIGAYAKAMSANDITAHLLIEIPKRFTGARVWRRNVGKAVGWDTTQQAVQLIRGGYVHDGLKILLSRPIKFGMPGESDIDGIAPPNGRRISIEVKAGRDTMRSEQDAFRAMVLKAGGVHIIARSVEQALKDLEEQLNA